MKTIALQSHISNYTSKTYKLYMFNVGLMLKLKFQNFKLSSTRVSFGFSLIKDVVTNRVAVCSQNNGNKTLHIISQKSFKIKGG